MAAKQIETLVLSEDGVFPNSPLPVLVYRGATGGDGPNSFEELFQKNNWPPQWRGSVFNYHHYHSNSHECLGVAAGHAVLRLGGPSGADVRLEAGDAVVIPAGVAHQRALASSDFMVVGAYPPGEEEWDTLRGNPGERPKADEAISKVPVPETDPVEGSKGAILEKWR